MSTATLSKRHLAVFQNAANQNPKYRAMRVWEVPAIAALERMHRHVTGKPFKQPQAVGACLDDLHRVTGESVQYLLNTAAAIIELEQLNFTIH